VGGVPSQNMLSQAAHDAAVERGSTDEILLTPADRCTALEVLR
jgi:hypothetical protein